MKGRSSAAIVALLLATGCAGSGLRVVTTPHFQLTTDLYGYDARDAAERLERERGAFVDTFFRCAEERGSGRVDVAAFRDRELFEHLTRRSDLLGGQAISYPQGIIERPATLAVHWTERSQAREIVRHELTHRLVAQCMPQAPLWLHEGLAGFLSTAQVNGDRMRVGVPPFVFIDSGNEWVSYGSTWARYVPRESLLSLEELRSSSTRYIDDADDADAARSHAAYASAWALVATLESRRHSLQRPFRAYLRALRLGMEEQEAWDRHLGDENVEEHYARFIDAERRWVHSLVVEPTSVEVSPVRALSEAGAEIFLARHMRWDTAPLRQQAEVHLQAAARYAPSSDEQHEITLVRAALSAEDDNASRALALLRELPDEVAAPFPRLAARLSSGAAGDGGAQVDPAAVRAAARRAQSAFEFNIVARAWLRLGRDGEALGAAHQAVARDLSCATCWATLGVVQMRIGQRQHAMRSLRRGRAFAGLHARSNELLQEARAEYDRLGAAACEGIERVPEPNELPVDQPDDEPVVSRVNGSLTADSIRMGVRGIIPAVTQCLHEDELFYPVRSDVVVVRFLIERDGHVAFAHVEESRHASVAFRCCVLRLVRGIQFDATDGGVVTVTYPFTIQPGGGS